MSDDKVIDLSQYLSNTDPGDEQPRFEHDGPTAEEAEEVFEVSIEEILSGFAQGLELLRLGILSLDARLTQIEESLGYVEEEPAVNEEDVTEVLGD